MCDFQLLITKWFRLNKRDLPWRKTSDPYSIWLSEIILQQTKVDQGLVYYQKFIAKYPTIQELANASENEILNDWQGLGYYSRARNLHFTAKHIVVNLNAKFPTNFKDLLPLKGIGQYTAAAIASFCFNEKIAVVDGNVYRALSRIFGIRTPIDSPKGKKEFQVLANSLIGDKPAAFNQAIMEFGALQCTPKKPNCTSCPFADRCIAVRENIIHELPIKSKKTQTRNRYFHYFIFDNGKKIVLQKRTQKDIWQNMYEFPLLETKKQYDDAKLLDYCAQNFQLMPSKISNPIRHILSHQKIYARFIHFNKIPSNYTKKAYFSQQLNDLPLPRLIDRYLEDINC